MSSMTISVARQDQTHGANDEQHDHQCCPTGSDSWCKWWAAWPSVLPDRIRLMVQMMSSMTISVALQDQTHGANDEQHDHQCCPTGSDSWCKWWAAWPSVLPDRIRLMVQMMSSMTISVARQDQTHGANDEQHDQCCPTGSDSWCKWWAAWPSVLPDRIRLIVQMMSSMTISVARQDQTHGANDEQHDHQCCPTGSDSWCKWWAAWPSVLPDRIRLMEQMMSSMTISVARQDQTHGANDEQHDHQCCPTGSDSWSKWWAAWPSVLPDRIRLMVQIVHSLVMRNHPSTLLSCQRIWVPS